MSAQYAARLLYLTPRLDIAMTIKDAFSYLCVSDAAAAADFYRDAFGAVERFRLVEPGGRVGHMELDFGSTTVMFSEAFPDFGVLCPPATGAQSHRMHLHVDNADAVLAQAVSLGATLERAAQDQFYGERAGVVLDPFGHRWLIGHEIEAVSTQEMQRRYTAMCTQS